MILRLVLYLSDCTENLNPRISEQENKGQFVFSDNQLSTLSWFWMSLLGSFVNMALDKPASRITGSFSALASSHWSNGCVLIADSFCTALKTLCQHCFQEYLRNSFSTISFSTPVFGKFNTKFRSWFTNMNSCRFHSQPFLAPHSLVPFGLFLLTVLLTFHLKHDGVGCHERGGNSASLSLAERTGNEYRQLPRMASSKNWSSREPRLSDFMFLFWIEISKGSQNQDLCRKIRAS